MKISEIYGEEALDVLADLIEPASEIMADREIASLVRSKQNPKAVKVAIKNHKKQVIEILAVLEGEDPKEYKPHLLTLPAKVLEILNDQEFQMLFSSQIQSENASSGSVTENTGAEEK